MAKSPYPEFSMTDGLTYRPQLVEPVWTTTYGLLEIRVANVAGDWTFGLVGELDLSSIEALEREIRPAETSGSGSVTIDLSRLEFIDSSGLRLILQCHHLSRIGSRLRLVKGNRAVQAVFTLTQTEDSLPFLD